MQCLDLRLGQCSAWALALYLSKASCFEGNDRSHRPSFGPVSMKVAFEICTALRGGIRASQSGQVDPGEEPRDLGIYHRFHQLQHVSAAVVLAGALGRKQGASTASFEVAPDRHVWFPRH
eukprot:g39940.t1